MTRAVNSIPAGECPYELTARLTAALDALPEGSSRQIAALHACGKMLQTAAYDILDEDNASFAADMVIMSARIEKFLESQNVLVFDPYELAEKSV